MPMWSALHLRCAVALYQYRQYNQLHGSKAQLPLLLPLLKSGGAFIQRTPERTRMALTAKQEAFAQAVAGGMTQSDAYRSAYDAENMGANPIAVEACRLMDDPNVSLRLKELRNQLSEIALWTRQDSVRVLKSIADGLGSETKPGEAVSAVKELNSMHGFNEATKHDLALFFPKVINVIAGRRT